MCRLAAYLGVPIPLSRFLIEPSHSLMNQASAPRELQYATMNADGFGIGWYAADHKPAVYRNILPIWNDVNLGHLGRSLNQGLYVGMVRSATIGNPVSSTNTQPYFDDELMLAHNGYITRFHSEIRARFERELKPAIRSDIQGTTDSEYLFALLRQLLQEDKELTMEHALLQLCATMENWLADNETLLNLVVSDGERLYALRHAFNHPCPTLYYSTDDDLFPDAQLIASERLTESDYWQPVPEHQLLVLDRNEPPELIAL